jgi:hypothetical protein
VADGSRIGGLVFTEFMLRTLNGALVQALRKVPVLEQHDALNREIAGVLADAGAFNDRIEGVLADVNAGKR